jgi:hypothetical protein
MEELLLGQCRSIIPPWMKLSIQQTRYCRDPLPSFQGSNER